MTECVQCQGRSNNAYLCSRCAGDLRTMLEDLALGPLLTIKVHGVPTPIGDGSRGRPWLACLEDTRYAHTRLGESERRSGERNAPLMVRLGNVKNPSREEQWKGSPLELLRSFHGVLATWIRHITESRGATFAPVSSVPVWFIGPLQDGWRRLPRNYTASIIDCAEWLAHHIGAVANDEAAAELISDVKAMSEAIARIIDRPVAPVPLGPCPTLVAHHQECAIRLSAPPAAVGVTCQGCGATYATEDLFERTLEATAYRLMTSRELGVALAALGTPVPLRLLRDWRYQGRLKPATFQGEEALYRFGEARKLAEEAAAKSRKTA